MLIVGGSHTLSTRCSAHGVLTKCLVGWMGQWMAWGLGCCGMMRQRRGKVHTTTEDQVCGHCGGQVLLAEETIQGITTGDPQLDYRGGIR